MRIATVRKQERAAGLRYHLFTIDHGDDNDNSVADLIVVADSPRAALEALERRIARLIPRAEIDGDENSVNALWFRGDIPMHHDHRYVSSHATESDADSNRARYHENWGTYRPHRARTGKT